MHHLGPNLGSHWTPKLAFCVGGVTVLRVSPTCVLRRPRWPQEGPKKTPRGPERAPRGSKRAPRCPKRRPRGAQESQEKSKEGPRQPQDGPKSSPSRGFLLHYLQEPPRGPQDTPPDPQKDAPRAAPGDPKEPPRGAQETPRGPQEGPVRGGERKGEGGKEERENARLRARERERERQREREATLSFNDTFLTRSMISFTSPMGRPRTPERVPRWSTRATKSLPGFSSCVLGVSPERSWALALRSRASFMIPEL